MQNENSNTDTPNLDGFDHDATYSPEDNKLRLYFGYRIPKDEWNELKAAGWVWTMKQDSDICAPWTPEREAAALAMAGYIGDEGSTLAERAADRAERFSGYLSKRLHEARGHADSYEAGPAVHGYQSQAKAEAAARKHDREAVKACNQWSNAEYWQSRTAGVISNALYKLRPDVRARRIKKLQSEERKHHKHAAECRVANQARYDMLEHFAQQLTPIHEYVSDWTATKLFKVEDRDALNDEQRAICQLYDRLDNRYTMGKPKSCEYIEADPSAENAQKICKALLESYTDGRPVDYTENETGDRWADHFRLRLAYEQAMLNNEVGALACDLESIERGGMWRGQIIRSASKNKTSGKYRGLSVLIEGEQVKLKNIKFSDTQDATPYEAPTPESTAKQAELWKAYQAAKAETRKAAPAKPKLVNPTDEDAERLQALINENEARTLERYRREPGEVLRLTQAQYSAHSKGAYARLGVELLKPGGRKFDDNWNANTQLAGCVKIRAEWGIAPRVIVITDKPQKPLPAEVFTDPLPAMRAEFIADTAKLERLAAICRGSGFTDQFSDEDKALFTEGRLLGLVRCSSLSQYGLTETGEQAAATLESREEATA